MTVQAESALKPMGSSVYVLVLKTSRTRRPSSWASDVTTINGKLDQSVVQQRTVDDKVRSGIISVEKLYNVLGQKLDPVGNPIPEERFKTNLKKSIGMLKERRGRTLLKSRDLVMNFVLKTFENDPSQFENLFNTHKAYRQSQVSSTGQAE
eukprot:jgi/Tetstr1/461701/TSEL_006801.t1